MIMRSDVLISEWSVLVVCWRPYQHLQRPLHLAAFVFQYNLFRTSSCDFGLQRNELLMDKIEVVKRKDKLYNITSPIRRIPFRCPV